MKAPVKKNRAARTDDTPPANSDCLTLSQVESHLWEAANILRGPVDAADFKTYVFPLLFFKRISDVHDEEYQAAQVDILGQSYEYLIKKFADLTNKKAGEFYTPRSVVRLMVNILDPHEGESIYDPACGTGGMLLEAVHHVLILDASKECKIGRAQNELLPEHVERIHAWCRDFKDVEGVARVVALDEIAANEHNLNIPRYVEPKVDQEALTVDEAMKRLRNSAKAAFAAEEKLIGILKREGLLQ